MVVVRREVAVIGITLAYCLDSITTLTRSTHSAQGGVIRDNRADQPSPRVGAVDADPIIHR